VNMVSAPVAEDDRVREDTPPPSAVDLVVVEAASLDEILVAHSITPFHRDGILR